jgi:serine/threonine protein kinase
MLNRAGDVKIADFGISSQLNSTGALCETFVRAAPAQPPRRAPRAQPAPRRASRAQVGTTCYMSPERLAGEPYSYAADVWAYGLILLELATGRFPYPTSDSYFALLGTIMDQPAPTLPEDSRLSPEFRALLSLCLDKQPQMRPSAKDLLKHPWFRAEPLEQQGAGSVRHEGGSRAPLDRSRSNLNDLDVSGMLDTLSLGR